MRILSYAFFNLPSCVRLLFCICWKPTISMKLLASASCEVRLLQKKENLSYCFSTFDYYLTFLPSSFMSSLGLLTLLLPHSSIEFTQCSLVCCISDRSGLLYLFLSLILTLSISQAILALPGNCCNGISGFFLFVALKRSPPFSLIV